MSAGINSSRAPSSFKLSRRLAVRPASTSPSPSDLALWTWNNPAATSRLATRPAKANPQATLKLDATGLPAEGGFPGCVRPQAGLTPPRSSSASISPVRLHQVFRCRALVFRFTARGSTVLGWPHENYLSVTKTVHREFSGRVVRNGRRGGVWPIQREYPADWGV